MIFLVPAVVNLPFRGNFAVCVVSSVVVGSVDDRLIAIIFPIELSILYFRFFDRHIFGIISLVYRLGNRIIVRLIGIGIPYRLNDRRCFALSVFLCTYFEWLFYAYA